MIRAIFAQDTQDPLAIETRQKTLQEVLAGTKSPADRRSEILSQRANFAQGGSAGVLGGLVGGFGQSATTKQDSVSQDTSDEQNTESEEDVEKEESDDSTEDEKNEQQAVVAPSMTKAAAAKKEMKPQP